LFIFLLEYQVSSQTTTADMSDNLKNILLPGMHSMKLIVDHESTLRDLIDKMKVSPNDTDVEHEWKFRSHLMITEKSDFRRMLPNITSVLCGYVHVFSTYLQNKKLTTSIDNALTTIEYTRDHTTTEQLLYEIDELLIDMCPHKYSKMLSHERLPNVFNRLDNDIIEKNYIIFRYIKYLLIFMMNRRTREALGFTLFDL
jgi:hypothetical protein